MGLQWTAVAIFLYVEIALILLLCLPFISAKRWQRVFHLRVWNWMSRFWNKVFLTIIIIILIVVFCDAAREVRKYSGKQATSDAKLQPNLDDHLHMELFRAQRNLYISGFAVFLWLVMKRVVTLLSQLASTSAIAAAFQTQADKNLKESEQLKQVLMEGKGDKATAVGMELLRKEVEKLKRQLKFSTDCLTTAQLEKLKKDMARSLASEFDKKLKERQNLNKED
ncbi:unnamed protein product [Ophioblennius macclurei]